MKQLKPNQRYWLSIQKAIQDYKDGIITTTGLVCCTELLDQKASSLLSKPAYLDVIYALWCLKNGRCYIGITRVGSCPRKPKKAHTIERFSKHKRKLSACRHPVLRLQEDWNKYGKSAFAFEVLEVFEIDTRVHGRLGDKELRTREGRWHKVFTDTYSRPSISLKGGAK